jgi:hypothetical protein
MMYSFYVTVHARAAGVTTGDEIDLAGRKVRPLRIERDALGTTTMNCSFEEARARLSKIERMYSEPDGSFVWASSRKGPPWQIDGNLYDRDGRLLFVDLKGTCPAAQFDRLLQALGWPETILMFQLTRQAVFLDEAEFRRFAEADVRQ